MPWLRNASRVSSVLNSVDDGGGRSGTGSVGSWLAQAVAARPATARPVPAAPRRNSDRRPQRRGLASGGTGALEDSGIKAAIWGSPRTHCRERSNTTPGSKDALALSRQARTAELLVTCNHYCLLHRKGPGWSDSQQGRTDAHIGSFSRLTNRRGTSTWE